MVNKLYLQTDRESFIINPIFLLHLSVFLSISLIKSTVLSKNNPTCVCDEYCWFCLPLKVNLGWSPELILRENNASVAYLLESRLNDNFRWWVQWFIVSQQQLRSEREKGWIISPLAMIELCCEYLSVRCIWLHVLIMSCTCFRVKRHSINASMSKNSLLKTGAISEV